ncbi:hypothetical protein [Bacillus infantis]|nr:hypothetical protein [Bacillus infantis]
MEFPKVFVSEEGIELIASNEIQAAAFSSAGLKEKVEAKKK